MFKACFATLRAGIDLASSAKANEVPQRGQRDF